MAEMTIRFDVRVSPTAARCALAGLLLCLAAPDIGSEGVVLTSDYPAPVGTYLNLLTTGSAYLARDGGGVGIGTASPTHALDVTAAAGDQARFLSAAGRDAQVLLAAAAGQAATAALAGGGAVRWWIGKQGDDTFFLRSAALGRNLLSTAASGDVVLQPGAGSVAIGHSAPGSALDVGGDGIIAARQPGGQCRSVDYPPNATSACVAGEYATSQSGFYSAPAWNHGGGTIMCCKCPSGGCPALP